MKRSTLNGFLVAGFVFIFAVTGFAKESEKRTFKVAVQAPATNFKVNIDDVFQAGDKIWVIARVRQTGSIGGAAITLVKDKVTIKSPAGDVVTYIVGRSSKQKDANGYRYVSEKEMKDLLAKQKKAGKLKLLFERPNKETKKVQ